KRQRDIAGDVQTIQVSGIVRRSDITFNNTVSSEQVANFHLVISNEGVSETYNKVGWLGQIFDTVWPF
ncbi:MAG: flagellar basal body L-ring protein FlgH, partial [Planctomycetes bacterium]|nr:flagellar basal body L-ring protein FlgH [Planctomycetota bacterium]